MANWENQDNHNHYGTKTGRSINAQHTEALTASELAKKIGKGLTAKFVLDNFPTWEWHHANRSRKDGQPVNFYDPNVFI